MRSSQSMSLSLSGEVAEQALLVLLPAVVHLVLILTVRGEKKIEEFSHLFSTETAKTGLGQGSCLEGHMMRTLHLDLVR